MIVFYFSGFITKCSRFWVQRNILGNLTTAGIKKQLYSTTSKRFEKRINFSFGSGHKRNDVLRLSSALSSCASTKRDNKTEKIEEYGTKTVIKSTPFPLPPTHPLAPYIEHSIQNPQDDFSITNKKVDTTFSVTFLGTGAGGRPNPKRAPTSTALRIPGHTFLFDAGEGTQRQLSLSNLGIKNLGRIFVTHMHADHVAGLLGIILMKEMFSKNLNRDICKKEKLKLDIYGPVGLYNYIAMNVALTCSKIRNIDVVVHELVAKIGCTKDTDHKIRDKFQNRNSRNFNAPTTPGRSVLQRQYPELSRTNIHHKQIFQSPDKTWIIQKSLPLERETIPDRNADNFLSISAAEVSHQPGVQTFGYVVEEASPLPKIVKEKAIKLGVRPGLKFRSLKNGFSVMNDDETREVLPHEVLENSSKKGRKLVVFGDAWKIPGPMRKLSFGADLLIHEATLPNKMEKMNRERGHSSAGMAGKVAKELQSKVLAMNHISGRLDRTFEEDSKENFSALREASECNENVSDILVAHDFMMINVPNE